MEIINYTPLTIIADLPTGEILLPVSRLTTTYSEYRRETTLELLLSSPPAALLAYLHPGAPPLPLTVTDQDGTLRLQAHVQQIELNGLADQMSTLRLTLMVSDLSRMAAAPTAPPPAPPPTPIPLPAPTPVAAEIFLW